VPKQGTEDNQIAVFGLGKLGVCLASVLADGGHFVRGYDPSMEAVEAFNSGIPITPEPGLEDLIAKNRSRLAGFSEPRQILEGSEVAFIIVPTPSNPNGEFTNQYVRSALQEIGANLREKPRGFTVVIASTVMPGSCVKELAPFLESESGLKIGESLGFAYSPQFIALGSVLKNMQFPDLVLIGQSDPQTGDTVENIARTIVKNRPEVRRMSLTSAEVSKLAVNTFVTTKISFANMLGELCDQLPGADVDDVTKAVGSDSRVGSLYIKAGLGYGGPCFPRDNSALAFAAESRGVGADIARATDAINVRQVDRVCELVLRNSSTEDVIVIVGIAYKSGTTVMEASQSVEIAQRLALEGRKVNAYDPLVATNTDRNDSHANGFEVTGDASCIGLASMVVIANPEIVQIGDFRLREDCLILDLWGDVPDSGYRVIRPGASRNWSSP